MPTVPYVKNPTWADGSGGGTSIDAADLNKVENGIFEISYAPTVRVFHNADQSIATATWTVVAFNSEDWDTAANVADTMHDPVTNNSRLTCRYAGKYQASATLTWTASATGQRFISIIKGAGPTPVQGDFVHSQPGNGNINYNRLAVSGIYDLAVNDFLQVAVFQDSGAGLNVLGTTAVLRPIFGMVRVA